MRFTFIVVLQFLALGMRRGTFIGQAEVRQVTGLSAERDGTVASVKNPHPLITAVADFQPLLKRDLI